LQHAWANLYHDRVYKSEFKLPTDLKRQLMRIAAILEDADENFARAIRTVGGYREYYGAYLPRDQLNEELEKLQAVRAFDPTNLKLALKTARIAVLLERWTDTVQILQDFVAQWESVPVIASDGPSTRGEALDTAITKEHAAASSAERRHAREALEEFHDPQAASLLLDCGWALWRLGVENNRAGARRYLNWAAGLNLSSADALIAQAETYDEDDNLAEALRLYRKAFEVNPLEPRAVRGYLQLTAEEERNLDFVAPMRPTLRNVIQRCRERATLGIYLPWAYFDIGCFSLLLGEPYEGIEAYAKAIELSHSETSIDASLKRARRLCRALRKTGATEWSLLERFLLIARIAKRYRLAEDALAEVRAAEEALTKLKNEPADAARAELEAAKARAQELRTRADSVRSEIGPQVANSHCPVFHDAVQAKLVIVAGGCAPEDAQRLRDYAPLLERAFQDFAGIIFSGGTRSGIGKMVGDLPASPRGPILKVACLPEAMPTTNHERHKSYEYYTHPGQGFSPLGAVQVWADILNQGILPSTVRVIGISGGKLAGLEYRLALMMGAKVGVLKGSGRAADAILDDPDWMEHPNLIALPYDPQTVKLFVAGFSSGVLTEAQREEAARLDHERNVDNRMRERVQTVPPENQPWDLLRPDLKASILERVDLITEQLNAVHLRAVKQDQLPPGATPVTKFSTEQIETMAEIEHGRWCVRKFLDGWRLGERKDDQAKTHQDLIAWAKLENSSKEKDRNYVRKIPDLLREQGFAIVPAE
jgi:tetratricopeptide (TPR) repeat protein